MSRPLEWWLSRLNDVKKTPSGYSAKCPSHDDRVNSLSLTIKGTEVLVHCFVASLEETREPLVEVVTIQPETPRDSPLSWWENYTGVPRAEWEAWGCRENRKEVIFSWPSLGVAKRRKLLTKEYT